MSRKRLSLIAAAATVVASLVAGPPARAAEPDTTPPAVTITTPAADPPTVVEVDASLIADFACADPDVDGSDTSGVASCAGMFTLVPDPNDPNPPTVQPVQVDPGQPLDTSQPGQYEFRVIGTDVAGNTGNATSSFTVVGQEPKDTTAPTIEITAPVDGAQVKKGLSLIASYSCSDSESGLASCEGPVPSGETIDTSSVGQKDFTVTARDAAGNESHQTVVYEVIPPGSVTISGTIKDSEGNLLPGSTVEARLAGTLDLVASTEANTNGIYSLTLPEGTYDLRYRGPEGSGIGANLKNRDLNQDREINVTLGMVPITVSGVVSDGAGGELYYGVVNVLDESGVQAASLQVGADGRFSGEFVPGRYRFQVGLASSLGYFNFSMGAQDFDADSELALSPVVRPVTVHLVSADGSAAGGQVRLVCYQSPAGQDLVVAQDTTVSVVGTGDVVVWGAPTQSEQRCELSVDPDEGPNITRRIEISADQPNDLTLTIERGITVSGVVSDGAGGELYYGVVNVLDESGVQAASLQVGADGRFSGEFVPGRYRFQVGLASSLGYFNFSMGAQDFDADSELALSPVVRPVTVHLVSADGSAAGGQVRLVCYQSPAGQDLVVAQDTTVSVVGTGDVVVWGAPTQSEQRCELSVDPDEGPNITRSITIDPDTGAELTVFTFGAGVVINGGTNATNDGDNVADAVEALAPNNGDGNGDGTPDYEQQNVTSLPVNGGSLGSGEHYVTVAAPAGTELTNVYTIDPADITKVEVAPPPGVTLPEGLTNLVLKGVESGTDQTLSIFTASTANVTGYAKYNPATREWSLLPEDRVQIFENRVEITLTDGGIGDDDGEANGRISDPGGIAIVENLDTVAPTVTGATASAPNADGWYNGDVTVHWTATDPEPSSGLGAQPADTVITGEGDNLSSASAEVCDASNNCATGHIHGIKIDRTKPEVSVTGIQAGKTYILGAVPAAACTATDALSGMDGACTATLAGGNANGVGQFTYTVKAADKAGNERTTAVSYSVVYRFDGFLQPINDPVLVPGAAKSVFKTGSAVPVKLQLKRADGTVVDPLAVPEWLNPEKGSATSATVNENVWTDAVTSGTLFEKTDDQWHYNWKTKGVAPGYNYRIGVKLDDGTTHHVVVAAR
ncbi:MAG: PxKF domain-containing protein [Candidatus Nanopelagicales bacterium]